MHYLLAKHRRAAADIVSAAFADDATASIVAGLAPALGYDPFGVHKTHDANGQPMIVRVPEVDWTGYEPYSDLARAYGIAPLREDIRCPKCDEPLGTTMIDGKAFVACLTALNSNPLERCRWKQAVDMNLAQAEGQRK